MRHLRHLAFALCATLVLAIGLARPASAAPIPPTVGLTAGVPLTELVAGTEVTIEYSFGSTVVATHELAYMVCDTDQQTDCNAEVPIAVNTVVFDVPSGQSGRYLFGVMHTFDGSHVELGRYVSAAAGPLAGTGTFRLSDSAPVPGDVVSVVAQAFYPEPTGVSPTWQRCDANVLSCVDIATSATYSVTNDDAGHTLRADVAYTHVLEAGPVPTAATPVIPFDYSAMGVEWSGSTPVSPTPGDEVDYVGTAGYDEGTAELLAALGSSVSTDGQIGALYSCPSPSFNMTCTARAIGSGADFSDGPYTVTQADEGTYLLGTVELQNLGGGFSGTVLVTDFRQVEPFVPTVGTFALNNWSPTIGGTVSVQNLGWDPDPDISAYVWHSCTGPSACATVGTSATYTVTSSDAGRYLYATMTYTQSGGSSASDNTGASDPVPNVVGTYELSDTSPFVGDVVSASPAGWAPAPVVSGMKWYSCSDIDNCTMVSQSATYEVASSDSGHMLKFEAVYTQVGSPPGYSYTALSDTVPTVGTFELSDTSPVLGDVLSISVSGFAPAADVDASETVWSRCVPGVSCTQVGDGATYIVTLDDFRYAIHASVDYTQAAGPITTGYTDDSDLVGLDTQNWSITIGPEPVSTEDDLVFTMSPSLLVGIDAGAASINGVLFAATASTQVWACDSSVFSASDPGCELRDSYSVTDPAYSAADEDAGLYLISVVNYPDIGSPFPTAQTVVSTALGPVRLTQPPVSDTRPVLSGTLIVGDTVEVSNGTWTGDTPMTFTYRWLRCAPGFSSWADCPAIADATDADYTPVTADIGSELTAEVTATNADGEATEHSLQSGLVASVPLTGPVPTTTGTTRVGDTLTASHAPWTGTGSLTYTWTWSRCAVNVAAASLAEPLVPLVGPNSPVACDTIAGATAATYMLTVADVGYAVKAVLHISDVYSRTAESSAAPTLAVVPEPGGSLSAGVRTIGDSIIVSGTGFAPFTDVTVTLFSDPVVLGTVTTDRFGAFTQTSSIPASTPAGAHHIVLTGVDGNGDAAEVSMAVTLTDVRVVDLPTGSTDAGSGALASSTGGLGTTPSAGSRTGATSAPSALALTGSETLALIVWGIFTLAAGGMFLALSGRVRRQARQ